MALTLTTPNYRIFQRNAATGKGTISVAGTGTVNGATVEARWNGGAWTNIGTVVGGAFSGSLTEQSSGQGDLEVRENGGAVEDTAQFVGVGSIFVGAGASNMSGRGTNNQSYSHATLKAAMFGNDYLWQEMTDPTDSVTGQVDNVSKDTGLAAGSWIPHLATAFMAEYGYPMAYVPCPKGGTTAEDWDDVGVDRATLFGSMAYRLQQVGGAELMLWMTNGDNIPSYRASMTTIASALPTYGCDYVMQISGTRSSGYTPANLFTTWKEQRRLASSHPNIVEGTSLRALYADDAYHMLLDEKLAYAGQKVFEAIKRFKTALEGGSFRQTII